MDELLKKTDICVKCGLCLPYCPTYTKTQNENDSPRGRIALIQGWAAGQLDDTINNAINRCLLCRECERVCPALVPYSEIIDEFRALQPKPSNLAIRLLNTAITHKKLAKTGLKLYQNPVLKPLAKVFSLAAVERLLPDHQNADQLNEYYPVDNAQGIVGLFVGCLAELVDIETVHDAIKVLNHLGFTVWIPKQQVCCGALAMHSGDIKKAEQLVNENQIVFNQNELIAIVSIATGCGSQLKEKHLKVLDISEFLQHYRFSFNALNKTVYLHTPCSLRNVLRTEQAVLNVLNQIPELTIIRLSNVCCGSAGDYMLREVEISSALLDDVLNQLEQTTADLVLTSNIGCALHIKAGIKQRGLGVKVKHPVSILASLI